MNSVGVNIPFTDIGEPEIEVGPGTRSYEAIERLQLQFRKSVQSVLDVEVGPELEGPKDEEIEELAADFAEEEIKGGGQ